MRSHESRQHVVQHRGRSFGALIIRACAAAAIIVGIWFVGLPYLLIANGVDPFPFHLGRLKYLGILPLGVGAGLFALVTWTFAAVGSGTPLVFDAPTRFVVAGPNRYVRNPMYVGDVFILLGEAVLLESSGVLVYAVALAVGLHVVVVVLEEPRLRQRFGPSYEAYCQHVPRWTPRGPWTRPARDS